MSQGCGRTNAAAEDRRRLNSEESNRWYISSCSVAIPAPVHAGSSFVHTLLMDGVLKESGCFNGGFIIEKPTGRSSRVRRSNILKAQIMVKVTERHGADGELL